MGIFNYTFDWSVLWRPPYGEMLVKGIATTLHLSLLAWLIALALGLTVGIGRVLPSGLARLAGAAYVQVFRNTPFLVQLFFWYFAAPLLLPKPAQEWLYASVPDYAYWDPACCRFPATSTRRPTPAA
jgi:glutamate/aspartate transport system permease protein